MDVREKLTHILTSEPEMLKNLNVSTIKLYRLVDKLIANSVTVQEWISVKDRLPDKHDRYLCNVKAFSFPDLRYFAILKYDDGGFIEGKIYTDDVTHWMPLPQPPKGE